MTAKTIELLSTDELIASVSDLNIDEADTREGRQAANNGYRAAIGNLEGQWQEWLRKTYLLSAPAVVHTAIFDYAWAEGHADGYSAVETHYSDLADIARTVRLNWI